MKKNMGKINFIYILMTFLILYTILFPADKLNIKEPLLVITLFLGYFLHKIKLKSIIMYFGLIYPLLTILYSLIRGNDIFNVFSYGYVWIFLLLIPIVKKIKFDYLKVFLIGTYIIAIIIDSIMIFDLFDIVSIYDNPLSLFFQNLNELQGLGKGIFSTFGYSIFYKSCPLIILSYAYFLYNKKIIKSIPLLLALMSCGTRANFLIAIIISALIPLFCYKKSNTKIIFSLIIIILLTIIIPPVYNKMKNLNELKYDRSEAIKIEDTKISFEIIKQSPINFLFGTGVGSSFYSSRGEIMMTYEFSFIDYLRQTGIVGILSLFFFIFYLLKNLLSSKKYWLLIAFLGYLAIAFTNPLLVTSTSFVTYLLVFNDAQRERFKGEIE